METRVYASTHKEMHSGADIMSSYVLSQVEMSVIWILNYSSLIVFMYLVYICTYVQ